MAPVTGTIGAASAKGFGWTAASMGGVGWVGISSVQADSLYDETKLLTVDSSGNVYIAYTYVYGGSTGAGVNKIDPDGVKLIDKHIYSDSGPIYVKSIDTDSSYIYFTFGASGSAYIVSSFSTSFVFQWSKAGNTFSGSGLSGSFAKVKSGQVMASAVYDAYIPCCCGAYYNMYSYARSYTTGGSLNFARYYVSANLQYYGSLMTVSSIDYEPTTQRFFLGTASPYNSSRYGYMMALTSNGSVTSGLLIGSGTTPGYVTSILTVSSPSQNVFATICTDTSVSYISKFTTTLSSVVNCKIFAPSGNFHQMDQFIDSNGDVYMCLYTRTSSGGVATIYVIKLNSSLVVQWQRKIDITGASYTSFSMQPKIVCNSTDYFVYFKPRSSSNTYYVPTLVKMPKDGTGVGGTASVGGYNFAYSESSLTFNSDGPGFSSEIPGGSSSTSTSSKTQTSQDIYTSFTTDSL